jgi:hypothetical protein
MVPTQTSPVPGPDGTYTVFAHLNAEKASLYRDILGTFVAERARFALALRPSEIQAALATASVGRNEREGCLFIGPVLGQIEMHAADEVPGWIAPF